MIAVALLIATTIAPGPDPLAPIGGPWGPPILFLGDPITSVAFLDGGRSLIAFADDPDSRLRSARLFDLSTGGSRAVPGPHELEAFAVSGDGATGLSSLLSSRVPERAADRLPTSGAVLAPLRSPFLDALPEALALAGIEHWGGIRSRTSRALSGPDRNALERVAALHFEGRGQVRDLGKGRSRASLDAAPPVLAMAVSSDGSRAVTTHGDSARSLVRGVDLERGTVAWSRPVPPARQVDLSPDGRSVVLTDFGPGGPRRGIVVLDAATGNPLFRIEGVFGIGLCRDARFDADGSRIHAVGGSPAEAPLVEIEVSSRSVTTRFDLAHRGDWSCLDHAPGTGRMAVGTEAGIVRLLPEDLGAGTPDPVAGGHDEPLVSVAILAGPSPRVATVDGAGRILIRNPGGKVVFSQELATSRLPAISSIAAVTRGATCRVRAADLGPSRGPTFLLTPADAGSVFATGGSGAGDGLSVLRRRIVPSLRPTCLDASPGFVVVGHEDGAVSLLPLGAAPVERLARVHDGPVLAVRLFEAPSGLVTASQTSLAVFRRSSRPPFASLYRKTALPAGSLPRVELSPDGKKLYLVRRSSGPRVPWKTEPPTALTIEIWDVPRGRPLGVSASLSRVPSALAASPQGGRLALAFPDGEVQLRDAESLAVIATGWARRDPSCLALDEEASLVAVGHLDATTVLLQAQ